MNVRDAGHKIATLTNLIGLSGNLGGRAPYL